MTSFDANALTNDVEGMAFLAAVLETVPSAGRQQGSFELRSSQPSWSIAGLDGQSIGQASDNRVPEAA